MSKKRIVVALGGNALGSTPKEQLELVKQTAKTIVDLAENYDVIIGHGNGPQVLSLIHISEPTRLHKVSRMPSSA